MPTPLPTPAEIPPATPLDAGAADYVLGTTPQSNRVVRLPVVNGPFHSTPAGGTTGQALVKTSGADYATAWSTIVTSPAGADTEVQFRDGTVFGAVADLTFNKTTRRLKVRQANAAPAANAIEVDDSSGGVAFGARSLSAFATGITTLGGVSVGPTHAAMGANAVAIGGATAAAANSVAVGYLAACTAGAAQGTAVGYSATAVARGTALGEGTYAGHDFSVAIGAGASTGASHEIVLNAFGDEPTVLLTTGGLVFARTPVAGIVTENVSGSLYRMRLEAYSGGTAQEGLRIDAAAGGAQTRLTGAVSLVGGQFRVAAPVAVSLTADQTAWAVEAAGYLVHVTPDAYRVVRGIAGMKGAAGESALWLMCNLGPDGIDITHQDAAAAAADRVVCPGGATLSLGAGEAVLIYYDPATQRHYAR